MNPPPRTDCDTVGPHSDAAPAANELEDIRHLLFGREKRQLESLQERIENPGLHSHDVSRVLPQAVVLASGKDGKLTAALTPAVESALKESIKRDPSVLVNAIFPVIGPAIRKSIAEILGNLVQSLNQTLEHSLSSQGLRWRLEALRTGKSFAEVVLAHTLVYRVEQVFLIHRQGGLLLQHLTAPHIQAQDPGMVSGMLTAIQDFAKDSFRVSAGETLHTLQIGELNVWVEGSPHVTLAAVIRGQAPYEFRGFMQQALESLHQEQQAALEEFTGDASPFELTRPLLEPCLQVQFADTGKKKSSAKLLALAAVPTVILVVWLGFAIRDQRRWSGFVERLRAEPGIVVTAAEKRWNSYSVSGLRDPLAAEPSRLLPEFGLDPAKFSGRWEPYQALSPKLVLQRAVRLLQPPDGVTLREQDGVLFARGQAPGWWIEQARTRALMLPGIHAFNASALEDEMQSVLAARQREVELAAVYFSDELSLVEGQDEVLAALATKLQEIRWLALTRSRAVRVWVTGKADNTGAEEQDLRLSLQRAGHVANLLAARGVPADLLVTTSIGARGPWRADIPAQEGRTNGSVTFRVVLEKSPTP